MLAMLRAAFTGQGSIDVTAGSLREEGTKSRWNMADLPQ
jgi:hypothetical protein